MGSAGCCERLPQKAGSRQQQAQQDLQSQKHIFFAFLQILPPNPHLATVTHQVPVCYLLCLAQGLRESPG